MSQIALFIKEIIGHCQQMGLDMLRQKIYSVGILELSS